MYALAVSHLLVNLLPSVRKDGNGQPCISRLCFTSVSHFKAQKTSEGSDVLLFRHASPLAMVNCQLLRRVAQHIVALAAQRTFQINELFADYSLQCSDEFRHLLRSPINCQFENVIKRLATIVCRQGVVAQLPVWLVDKLF